MRLSADLFRWGLAVLLMVPFLALGGWVTGLSALLWLALAAIVVGGALNAAAVVRGVRRVSDGRVVDDLLGSVDARGPESAAASVEPRQRLIFPDGDVAEPGSPALSQTRRRIGVIAALGLVALTAFGAWTLLVEQPLAIVQGELTLEETYAAWGAASRIPFVVSVIVWAVASLAVAAVVFAVSRFDGVVLGWLLSPRRFAALSAIAGSVIVTAAFGPYFSIGNNLPDQLPESLSFLPGGVASPLSTAFGVTGILLCCVAIALTVPRWGRRDSR